METLNNIEKRIMSNFEKTLPLLTEEEKERVLGFSEGMAYVKANKTA